MAAGRNRITRAKKHRILGQEAELEGRCHILNIATYACAPNPLCLCFELRGPICFCVRFRLSRVDLRARCSSASGNEEVRARRVFYVQVLSASIALEFPRKQEHIALFSFRYVLSSRVYLGRAGPNKILGFRITLRELLGAVHGQSFLCDFCQTTSERSR